MMHLPAEVCAYLLDLARWEIRAALLEGSGHGELIGPAHPVLHQPAGCFVSLHSRPGRALRGCIGRVEANWPLHEVVRKVARSVLADPRFVDRPVTASELAQLEIELSILSAPRPLDGPEGFDLHHDGIYMTLGDRRGCFLPQVARETGWTRQQLLERLCREKMGLPADAWRDPKARFEAFATMVIGPEPF